MTSSMLIKFKLLKSLLIFCILSTLTVALADDDDTQSQFACTDSANVMDCIEKNKPPAIAEKTPAAIPINGPGWVSYGPVSLGARYDSVLGWIPEINYVQLFYDNGLNLQLGYGANEQRANITLGHAFTPRQQIKITYEYLTQNLPFDYASGSVNQWVNQNAFGAAYQYLLTNPLFHSIDLSGYYIHANSKDLTNVIYYQDNDAKLNFRRIAGGTEETILSNLTLTPFRSLLITLGGGYSHLVYDTEYENDQDNTTIAYTAGLEFLITSHTKLGANIANSAAETDSSVKISQLFPAHIEAVVTGQHSQGQAGQPDSNSVSLMLSYPATGYAVTPDDSLNSLRAWVQTPVIRAPRVLAIKDEKSVQYAINSTNPPAQNVKTGQMIQPINTQQIFNFDPSLYDKVVYSLSLPNDGASSTSPQSQLNIDVKPDGSSVYNAIIYSTGPIPNSATPSGGANIYHVIVTALGYKNGLANPIQAQADLELNINFDPNNEPQWDKNKTNGSIQFDESSMLSGINLNSYLSPTPTQGVQFTLVGSYPNWDLKTDASGIWYLVRKADANGAFSAGDISNTAVSVVLAVKYANDPEGTPGTQQKLNVMVTPDDKITLSWASGAACQVNGGNPLLAIQPANDQIYPLNLDPCVQYTGGTGNSIKVTDDKLTYSLTDTDNYSKTQANGEGIKLNGNSLTVNGPISGLNTQYTIGFNIKSAAVGNNGSEIKASNFITIGNNLKVNAVGGNNLFSFANSPTYITSLVVNSLNPGGSYAVTASDNTTNMMECSGSINNNNQYLGCNAKPLGLSAPLPYAPDSKGQVSIMWWSMTTYPTISSITITANSNSR